MGLALPRELYPAPPPGTGTGWLTEAPCISVFASTSNSPCYLRAPPSSNRHGATSHAPYVEQVQLPKELAKQSTESNMLTSSHLRRQSSQRDDLVQEAAAQLPNIAAYADVVRRPRGSVLNVCFEAGSAFDWTMAERCRLGSIVAAVAPKRAL